MREENAGDVLVTYDRGLFGVLTDRDIVLRGVADGRYSDVTTVGAVCTSPPVVTLDPDDSTDRAAELTRQHAVRRIPVVEHGGVPVGVVALGDLAAADDPHSALADTGRAAPDH